MSQTMSQTKLITELDYTKKWYNVTNKIDNWVGLYKEMIQYSIQNLKILDLLMFCFICYSSFLFLLNVGLTLT